MNVVNSRRGWLGSILLPQPIFRRQSQVRTQESTREEPVRPSELYRLQIEEDRVLQPQHRKVSKPTLHTHPSDHSHLALSRRYIFELPNNDASLLPVASCVVVKSASDAASPLLDAKGKPVIRPYTPISPSEQEGELTFLIKRYDEGKMSKHIHGLKEGESLAIKGPIPKFEYKGTRIKREGIVVVID